MVCAPFLCKQVNSLQYPFLVREPTRKNFLNDAFGLTSAISRSNHGLFRSPSLMFISRAVLEIHAPEVGCPNLILQQGKTRKSVLKFLRLKRTPSKAD